MPYLRDRRYSLHFKTNLSAVVEDEGIYENICSCHLGNNPSLACTLCLECVIAADVTMASTRCKQSAVIIRDLHPLKRTERYLAQRKNGVWKSLQQLKAINKDSILCEHCNQLKDQCFSEAKHQKIGIEIAALRRKRAARYGNILSCCGFFRWVPIT